MFRDPAHTHAAAACCASLWRSRIRCPSLLCRGQASPHLSAVFRLCDPTDAQARFPPVTVHSLMSSTTLSASVLSRRRIFPIGRETAEQTHGLQPRCVPLSIVDNTLSGGPLTGCVWLWDSDLSGALSVRLLTTSLRHALSLFPWWCGQLGPRPVDADGDHTQRYGCLQLEWGLETDPGAELVIASSPLRLDSSLVPSHAERSARGGLWANTTLPKPELFSSTTLATTGGAPDGLPCLCLQLTSFACGGLAIAVKLPHSLADMTALMTFMRCWADINRTLLAGRDASAAVGPDSLPRFEPALMDGYAAGDIDGHKPDAELLRVAAALPRLHFDWWATSELNCPPPMTSMLQIPPQFTRQQAEPLGTPADWLQHWEWLAPTLNVLVDFTQAEVDAMLQEARAASPLRLSVNDVLLAHCCTEVCRAKGMQHDDAPVHVSLALSMRPRLQPPLPSTYIGAPFTGAAVTMTGRQWCELEMFGQHVTRLAEAVREAVSAFTAPALAAVLHEMAHELSPQRRAGWAAGRHICSGSWEREGVNDLEFGQDGGPRLAQYGPGPDMEGVIQLMKPKKGDGDGMSVVIVQQPEVMQRLIKSPTLRRFRPQISTL